MRCGSEIGVVLIVDNNILGGISFVCFELTGKSLLSPPAHSILILSHASGSPILAPRLEPSSNHILRTGRFGSGQRDQCEGIR